MANSESTILDPGSITLLAAATTVAAGAAFKGIRTNKTYEASGTTTAGAGAATVVVQGRNRTSAAWQTIGTITLTLSATAGTDDASDGFSSDDKYAYLRGNVTAISGTNASVNLVVSY